MCGIEAALLLIASRHSVFAATVKWMVPRGRANEAKYLEWRFNYGAAEEKNDF